ncbi:MAG TPA: DUF2911 domain-containing protein [Puia sp.]|nr:DUF2911 domain-containing protein [Puia sp.]
MKRILFFLAFVLSFAASEAQSRFPILDKSPMDMSYCPTNYPILKIQNKAAEPLVARVVYGRPQKDGRAIFGELEPYGSIWRLGANEATEIEFYKDVKVGTKKIKKGRYSMYALLNADKWSLIINKDTDTWGAFKYDSTKDLARIDVPVQKQTEITEVFSIVFEKNNANSSNMLIAWDDVLVKVPISW